MIERRERRLGIFLLELILGLLGFLGIGWIASGRLLAGILLLFVWWFVIALGAVFGVITLGLGFILWLPVWVLVPLISAYYASAPAVG